MKQSRLPDHLRRKGYRSPNRRAARVELERAKVAERFFMRGNVPENIEEDREFFLLFQEWKRLGSPKDGDVLTQMCARWMEVMAQKEADHAA